MDPIAAGINLLDGASGYEQVRVLGQGAQGLVIEARNVQSGEHVAIKLVPRGFTAQTAKQLLRELMNHYELSASRHAHIVELKDVFLSARCVGHTSTQASE